MKGKKSERERKLIKLVKRRGRRGSREREGQKVTKTTLQKTGTGRGRKRQEAWRNERSGRHSEGTRERSGGQGGKADLNTMFT